MFGWPVNVLDETYALVGAEGGEPTGGIGQAGPDSPYTGIVVYFEMENVETALARAEQLGGRRTLDPVSCLGRGGWPFSPIPSACGATDSRDRRPATVRSVLLCALPAVLLGR